MRVLVYGTLKMDFGNHGYLSDAKFIKEGEFSIPNHELKALPSSAFPYLVETGKTSPFIGELYEIDDDILVGLDFLEGHPNFYRREKFFIEGVFETYVYVIPVGNSCHDDVSRLPTINNFNL